jgi:F420-dependent oxidoreductase-like protein
VTYEAWTLMGALAAVTSTVRLGQMCTCNSYRPPSYLAKVAATIDVISNGRLEMGIGAGWYEHEYLGYGYEFPKPSVRIGQLREGVEIMQRMWTEDEVVYHGEYYDLAGAICRPKPVQEPHIPFWIAGGGEQLTLEVAARYASYTNFANGDLDVFNHKSQVLAGHCEAVGSDFDAIVRSTNLNVVCEPTEAEVEKRLDWIESHYARFVDADRAAATRKSFSDFAGTPDQLVERLTPLVAAGMTYAICYFAEAATDTSGLELFAKEVMPQL